MMTRKPNLLIWTLGTPLALVAVSTTAACATTTTPPSSAWQTQVDAWFQDHTLELEWNNPIISEPIYTKYKDTPAELEKALTLRLNPAAGDGFVLPQWTLVEVNDQGAEAHLKIQLISPENEVGYQVVRLYKSFAITTQEYVDRVYTEFANQLTLRPEVANQSLMTLFGSAKTEADLIQPFVLPEFLGVETTMKIPSQTISLQPAPGTGAPQGQLKFNLVVKVDGQFFPPSAPVQAYFTLEHAQAQVMTLLLQSDLQDQKPLEVLRESYLGPIRIIQNLPTPALVINQNLQGRNLVGPLDLRHFQTVSFGDQAHLAGNFISEVLFAAEATVNNLKSGLFVANSIETVTLPARMTNFNIGAFDPGVIIQNLAQIPAVQQVYDYATKTVYLNRVVAPDDADSTTLNSLQAQVVEILKLVARTQGGDGRTINVEKIILPNFAFETPYELKVTTKTITFNSAVAPAATALENFTTNLSNWTITRIHIPQSVVLIDSRYLPSASYITRDLNEATLKLIQNTTLNLDQDFELLTRLKLDPKLSNNIFRLDQLFATFATPQPPQAIQTLQKITINEPNQANGTLNVSNFASNLTFFTNQKSTSSRSVEFGASLNKITMDDFSQFRQQLSGAGVQVVRKKPAAATSWLDGNTLKVQQLQSHGDASNYDLVGLESLIEKVDLTNVTSINANLFKNLDFTLAGTRQPRALDLTSVTQVGQAAFQNVRGLTFSNLESIITIGQFGFNNANISGTITLSALTDLGSAAFENNANLTNVTFNNNLETIAANAFRNTGLNTLSLPTALVTIDQFAFSNTKITTLDLSSLDKLQTLNTGAFSSIATLTTVKWAPKLTTMADQLFAYNEKLTSFDSFTKLEQIGANAFRNTSIANNLELTAATTVGAYAFENTKISSLTLKTAVELGSGAFNNTLNLKTVTNFDLKSNPIEAIFGPNGIRQIDFQANATNLNAKFHYDSATQNVDLTTVTNWDNATVNEWGLFIKDKQGFNNVSLPKLERVPRIIVTTLLNTSIPIKKLIWAPQTKIIDFTLSSRSGLEQLDSEFLVGAATVPDYFLANTALTGAATLNLVNIKTIGNHAFKTTTPLAFTNTTQIEQIGDQSFRHDVSLTLGQNVMLQDQSFSGDMAHLDTLIPEGISFQGPRLSASYQQIYDFNTKTLDFTKAQPAQAGQWYDKSKWNQYLNIGKFLVSGEVKHLILPPLYVLWADFASDLGQVEDVTFSSQTQVLTATAFSGTVVATKPDQASTNVILDQAGFFKPAS